MDFTPKFEGFHFEKSSMKSKLVLKNFSSPRFETLGLVLFWLIKVVISDHFCFESILINHVNVAFDY